MLPVDLICSAIATQEGFFSQDPQAIPRARNNPGDLRYAGQIGASWPGYSPMMAEIAINSGAVPPIATFENTRSGQAALYRQVWEWVAMGLTLREMIARQDQATEVQYLANVLAWTKLPADTPVIDLLPPLMPA